MSVVIGIDPGSRITGYGIIKVKGSVKTYLASGCIRTDADVMAARLHEIYRGLDDIIETYQPTVMALEKIFVAHNVQSALKLGQARGVAMVAGVNHGLSVFEYTPREIKQAVVGTGAAKKNQVQQMVQIILKLPGVPQADAADALGVAICHIHHQPTLVKWSGK